MDQIEESFTAGDLRKIGLSRSRIRYWERRGLLLPRRQSGSREWRRYSTDDLETGRRMLKLLAMGLTLDGAQRNLARLVEIETQKTAIEAVDPCSNAQPL